MKQGKKKDEQKTSTRALEKNERSEENMSNGQRQKVAILLRVLGGQVLSSASRSAEAFGAFVAKTGLAKREMIGAETLRVEKHQKYRVWHRE